VPGAGFFIKRVGFMFIIFAGLLFVVSFVGFFIFLYAERPETSGDKKEVLHSDAGVLAGIIRRHSAMPSASLVRSNFSELRHTSSAAEALQDLLRASNMKYHELIGIMEAKFVQIDFRVAQLLRDSGRFYGKDNTKEIFDSHERKYQTLAESIQALIAEKRTEPFLKDFLSLNEFLNIYLRQLDCLIEEQKKYRFNNEEAAAVVSG
jgi:type III secretory pathway component EscV